eukprot:2812285-Prymnesium_polylepis.2
MGDLEFGLFRDWISGLMQTSGEDIFRMKGVVSIANSKRRFVFHSVHMSFSGDWGELWGPDEPRRSKLVFIGKNLDEEALAYNFNASLATPENLALLAAELRFAVGEEVECSVNGDALKGTVVEHMCACPRTQTQTTDPQTHPSSPTRPPRVGRYRHDSMPDGMIAPYRVRLEKGGEFVWASVDDDRFIRR